MNTRIPGSILLLTILSAISCNDDKGFTDTRDGMRYRILEVRTVDPDTGVEKKVLWMGENLKYETDSTRCYKDNEAHCGQSGRLYYWSAASNACPDGWRIPTMQDWRLLFDYYGGREVAGQSMIAKVDSGFQAKMAGFLMDGAFESLGQVGEFWHTSNGAVAVTSIGNIYVSYSETDSLSRTRAFSVRCMNDNPTPTDGN